MKCHACSAGTFVIETRDDPYEYKSQKTIIPGVNYKYCGNCKESFRSEASQKRYMELIEQFKRQVDATT